MKSYEPTTFLRDTPATDVEIAKIQRARAAGKAPKPGWYSPPKMPKPFEYDLRQRYPARVKAMFTRQSDTWLDSVPRDQSGNAKKSPAGDTLAEYIASYENLCHLKPVPTEWIKTEGNFA